eukprot:TRINITY_DN38165_c0_g1_i1.p1 TRINITY_DN38165_c0_g1~~TRINITY_DN38165_c0_g1_i1.p1  ORF type:complete len:390 (+),score=71.01 TRINITY_DN38165_c0_g1_i1:146-1171(+)
MVKRDSSKEAPGGRGTALAPLCMLLRVEIPALGVAQTAQLSLDRANSEQVLLKSKMWIEQVKQFDPKHTVVYDKLTQKNFGELVEKLRQAQGISQGEDDAPTRKSFGARRGRSMLSAFASSFGSSEKCEASPSRKSLARPSLAHALTSPVAQARAGSCDSVDDSMLGVTPSAGFKEQHYEDERRVATQGSGNLRIDSSMSVADSRDDFCLGGWSANVSPKSSPTVAYAHHDGDWSSVQRSPANSDARGRQYGDTLIRSLESRISTLYNAASQELDVELPPSVPQLPSDRCETANLVASAKERSLERKVEALLTSSPMHRRARKSEVRRDLRLITARGVLGK